MQPNPFHARTSCRFGFVFRESTKARIGLRTSPPAPRLSDDLSRQGHSVHECLAISEVFALAEEHFDAEIVIAADMEERWATEIQMHYPTMHLKPGATAKDILWELGLKDAKVQ